MVKLPEDLISFLKSDSKLDYDESLAEPGFVGLVGHEQIVQGVVWIEGESSGNSYYEIPAVNLTVENEYYDPEFILCWLPNEMMFGAWDSDHWELFTFRDISWTQIAQDPLPYINCQWDPHQKVADKFDPKGKYELIDGWPF